MSLEAAWAAARRPPPGSRRPAPELG